MPPITTTNPTVTGNHGSFPRFRFTGAGGVMNFGMGLSATVGEATGEAAAMGFAAPVRAAVKAGVGRAWVPVSATGVGTRSDDLARGLVGSASAERSMSASQVMGVLVRCSGSLARTAVRMFLMRCGSEDWDTKCSHDSSSGGLWPSTIHAKSVPVEYMAARMPQGCPAFCSGLAKTGSFVSSHQPSGTGGQRQTSARRLDSEVFSRTAKSTGLI